MTLETEIETLELQLSRRKSLDENLAILRSYNDERLINFIEYCRHLDPPLLTLKRRLALKKLERGRNLQLEILKK